MTVFENSRRKEMALLVCKSLYIVYKEDFQSVNLTFSMRHFIFQAYIFPGEILFFQAYM